jgi:hypothetical protein
MVSLKPFIIKAKHREIVEMATRNGSKIGKVISLLGTMSDNPSMKDIRIALNKAKLGKITDATIYTARNRFKKQNSAPKGNEPIILPSQVFNASNIKDVLIINRAVEEIGLEKAKSIINEMSKIK